MKKLKVGFGEGGFQGFMARHVEKCVLVVVILLMAYFIYSGSGAKSLDGSLTTEKMKQNAAEAEKKILTSTWTTVANERVPTVDVDRRVKDQVARVDPRNYVVRAWDPQLVPRLTPRMDPKLYPPEKLIATAIHGPLVLFPPETATSTEEDKAPEEYDPLLKFDVVLGGGGGYGGSSEDGAMPSSYDDEKPKSTRRTREKAQKGPMSGGGYEAYTQPKGKRERTKKGSQSSQSSESTSYPDSGYPMGSSMSAASSTTRSISPEATLGVKGVPGAELRPSTAIVINAVVPFEKQWNAYKDAFSSAPGGQDPMRDVPDYVYIYVQRADVTDDPSVDPADIKNWEPVSTAQLNKLEYQYAAQVPELADPEAVDDIELTHPVPPLLLTDLIPALSHPDIPRAAEIVETFVPEEEREVMIDEEGREIPIDEMEGSGEGSYGTPRMRGGSSGYGAGPGPRSGYGAAPGPRSGYGAAPGARSGYGAGPGPRSSYGAGPAPRTSYGAGPRGSSSSSSSDGPGPRMRSQPGMSSRMGGYADGARGAMDLERPPIAKKQVRFVDFDVKPGRKYRYRMMLALDDPNHPRDETQEPDITTLDPDALKRVKGEIARETKAGRRYGLRYTDYSEPTDIVSIPSGERYYAGETSRPGTIRINNVEIVTNEPQAKVLTVKWDGKLGVFAPAEQTVLRGGVLNTEADVEVIHPILGDLRKIPKYSLQTNGIVLDMFGGDHLPSNEKEPEKAPGETLILDAEGNLVVTDETTDVAGYRRYIFPEPKEKKEAAAGEGYSPEFEMTPPGESGYPGGYPGAGGKSKKAPRSSYKGGSRS